MNLPVKVDIEVYRGDSWTQAFVFTEEGVPKDLSGAAVAAWARNGQGVVQLDVTAGADGTVTIEQGAELLASGQHRYDVEVTEAGTVTTWVRGNLKVIQDVTNS